MGTLHRCTHIHFTTIKIQFCLMHVNVTPIRILLYNNLRPGSCVHKHTQTHTGRPESGDSYQHRHR